MLRRWLRAWLGIDDIEQRLDADNDEPRKWRDDYDLHLSGHHRLPVEIDYQGGCIDDYDEDWQAAGGVYL